MSSFTTIVSVCPQNPNKYIDCAKSLLKQLLKSILFMKNYYLKMSPFTLIEYYRADYLTNRKSLLDIEWAPTNKVENYLQKAIYKAINKEKWRIII